LSFLAFLYVSYLEELVVDDLLLDDVLNCEALVPRIILVDDDDFN